MLNEAVTEYIQELNEPWKVQFTSQLREITQASVPVVEERIQYGKPHFLKNG